MPQLNLGKKVTFLTDVMKNVWRRVLGWTRDQIVQDVPEELAFCEFQCREPQCTGRRDGAYVMSQCKRHRTSVLT
jgi:hypothetical protein